MAKKRNIDEVRDRIRRFRDLRRATKETQEVTIPSLQKELLLVLGELDPDGRGLVVDEGDAKTGVAFYQQNEASEIWDVEKIMDYIKKNKGVYMAVTSRVFDAAKWEAEIANGNIPSGVAKKMKTKGKASSPFIRFGAAKKGKDPL